MADYREVVCPSCKTRLGQYRADISEIKAHGHCKHCHKQYTIIHGNGKVKVVNEYA